MSYETIRRNATKKIADLLGRALVISGYVLVFAQLRSSPRQALVSLQHQTASERSGPDFSRLPLGPHDNDLLLNFNNGGLPIGERIIVSGRVMDQYGKPISHINPAIKYPRLCCVGDTWMPEIRTDSLRGHAMDALLVSPYLGPEMHILIPRIASRHIPEAGAVCGSSARTDLCGGRQVTAVPTATVAFVISLEFVEPRCHCPVVL